MAFGVILTSHVTEESAEAEMLCYLHYTREMRQFYSRSHDLSSGRSLAQVRWQLSPANTRLRGTVSPRLAGVRSEELDVVRRVYISDFFYFLFPEYKGMDSFFS